MKRFEEEPLLNDLFEGDDLEVLRRSSLEAGLAGLKRKRFRRHVGRVAVTVVVPVVVVLILLWRPFPGIKQNHERIKSNAQVAFANSSRPSTKIISERELFALFPNRPMALVGKPGNQRVVFLDQLSELTTETQRHREEF